MKAVAVLSGKRFEYRESVDCSPISKPEPKQAEAEFNGEGTPL